MLTARENMIEVLEHRIPERVVNQYEAMSLVLTPYSLMTEFPEKGAKEPVADPWGVYYAFPDNVPASFPAQDDAHILIKDMEFWQDDVKMPTLDFPEELWNISQDMFNSVDATKALRCMFVGPGIFETAHSMCRMEDLMTAMYEYPDEVHDLIKMLTDYELGLAEQFCSKIHPEALFHHDDWGSQRTTFMSNSMFDDFLLEPYKELYGYFHDHGVKYIIHHSDSYAATLVPEMIDMGINAWQGCFTTNNIPELIDKYGDKITFMGGIENQFVDVEGWTKENNAEVARRIIEECGNKAFIPCIAQGAPGSVYPGVYESLLDVIDEYNMETYGYTKQQLVDSRIPTVIID